MRRHALVEWVQRAVWARQVGNDWRRFSISRLYRDFLVVSSTTITEVESIEGGDVIVVWDWRTWLAEVDWLVWRVPASMLLSL